MKNIFIGKIIKDRVDELGMGYAEFARRIKCSRTSVYNIFESKSIDIERLIRISEILDYDFIGQIYLKKNPQYSHTFIQLPYRNGLPILSHIPKEILEILKKQIESQI